MSSATTNPPSKYNHAVADPVSYFHAIPWCHELLTSKRIVVPPSPPDRNPLASTEANIVRVTLNTPSTVKASVTWLQLPTREQRAEHIGETREKPFLEICALMDCNEGLAGRPGIMHGGITAVILDELLSTIAYMQGDHGAVTAYMNIQYKKPLALPSAALCKGRVVKRDGKKIYVKGSIVDPVGAIVAETDCMWILLSPKSTLTAVADDGARAAKEKVIKAKL